MKCMLSLELNSLIFKASVFYCSSFEESISVYPGRTRRQGLSAAWTTMQAGKVYTMLCTGEDKGPVLVLRILDCCHRRGQEGTP